jgi:hypothetical protein
MLYCTDAAVFLCLIIPATFASVFFLIFVEEIYTFKFSVFLIIRVNCIHNILIQFYQFQWLNNFDIVHPLKNPAAKLAINTSAHRDLIIFIG